MSTPISVFQLRLIGDYIVYILFVTFAYFLYDPPKNDDTNDDLLRSIYEDVENSENADATECFGSGTAENFNNCTETPSRVEETSSIKEEGPLKRNFNETYVAARQSLTFTEIFNRDCASTMNTIEKKRENNLIESKNNVENFVTQFREKLPTILNVTETKAHPQLEDFLALIFQWDPEWLLFNLDAPPVVDEKRLIATRQTYRSFDQYYETLELLVALEMWHTILDDFKTNNKDEEKDPIIFSVMPFSIDNEQTQRKIKVSTLNLEMVVSQQDLKRDAHPFNGDLMFFNYISNQRNQWGYLRKSVFAYVTEVRKTVIRPRTSFNRKLLEIVPEAHTLITISVMTKNLDPLDVQLHTLNELRKITYMGSNMRSVQALQKLHKSPLMNMIFYPRIEDYELTAAYNIYPMVTKAPMNTKQLEAVFRVRETHLQKLPKICLIQGPPGTGKSTVIVNLIMQMLHGVDRPNAAKRLKILVCAPSNTAVDSIVLKLLKTRRESDEEHHFFLVRTGNADKMDVEAKEVSLDKLTSKKEDESFACQCRRCEPLKQLSENSGDAKNAVLRNADVIAATLSSSYTYHMEKALNQNDDLVCIVDEASQCTEPESLIPLMLGVKTLILVGDPKQLPATVLSQTAKELGLDQSLFARIDDVFKDQSYNPIIRLNVQYRMAAEVALFPNNYFYDGKLQNAAKVCELPFQSYRVINHDFTQDPGKLSNSGEANFVARLIHTMLIGLARTDQRYVKGPIKVGIITGYQLQKSQLVKKIRNRIQHLKDKDKIQYDVNTVDSFQGQERDVIIMSCVRSCRGIGFMNDPHRLCVALTRAKHSLFICGNFKTFNKDRMWRALLDDAKSRGVYTNVNSNAKAGEIERLIIRRVDKPTEGPQKQVRKADTEKQSEALVETEKPESGSLILTFIKRTARRVFKEIVKQINVLIINIFSSTSNESRAVAPPCRRHRPTRAYID